MTNFDQDLKQSLATQASRVPHSSALGREAIVRARRIRRRRRVVGGVALAAMMVIAVPVGLQVGDAVSRSAGEIAPATTGPAPSGEPSPAPEREITGPTRVDIDFASLPLADEPPLIPYLDGRTVVIGDERINVTVDGDIKAAAAFEGGAHLFLSRGVPELIRVTPDGTEELGAAAASPLASADLRWSAYAVGEADKNGNLQRGITVAIFDSQNGSTAEVELPDATYVDMYAVVDGTAYFRPQASDGTKLPLQTWGPGQESPTVVPGNYATTAVSDDALLFAHITKSTDYGTQNCSDIVDRASGASLLWDTCKNLIDDFSPDGSFAWAGPEYPDGYSLGDLAILDARTGGVIRKLPSYENGLDFMDATFEDADHLLIRVEHGGQTALVRCSVSTGECELAVPVADGTSETGSPYLLAS